jgi:hypothetical protein
MRGSRSSEPFARVRAFRRCRSARQYPPETLTDLPPTRAHVRVAWRDEGHGLDAAPAHEPPAPDGARLPLLPISPGAASSTRSVGPSILGRLILSSLSLLHNRRSSHSVIGGICIQNARCPPPMAGDLRATNRSSDFCGILVPANTRRCGNGLVGRTTRRQRMWRSSTSPGDGSDWAGLPGSSPALTTRQNSQATESTR